MEPFFLRKILFFSGALGLGLEPALVIGEWGDEMELSAVKILPECSGLGRISHILFTAFCKGLREAEEGS